MRDKGIKIRDTLKQHILNNKKEYIVDSKRIMRKSALKYSEGMRA